MPFRLWFYLAKVGGFILFAIMLAAFFAPPNSILSAAGSVALGILIPLCVLGAIMGIFLAFGKLKMRCPFCGKNGQVGASRGGGLGMVCEDCGIIRATGPFGLKLIREPISDEDQEE